jgi:GNAT superfamily N-acetyltransferase
MTAIIRTLPASEIAPPMIAALSAVLIDCVEGGASVSFMHPLTRARADAFWQGVAARVAEGQTELLIAERNGAVVGTVQLCHAVQENQPHRADVAKMLVHRRARRGGIGAALMRAVEARARAAGKTLLVLDTVTGREGERLYARMGWTRVGVVPGYALFPDGALCDTTIFYKSLAAAPSAAMAGRG